MRLGRDRVSPSSIPGINTPHCPQNFRLSTYHLRIITRIRNVWGGCDSKRRKVDQIRYKPNDDDRVDHRRRSKAADRPSPLQQVGGVVFWLCAWAPPDDERRRRISKIYIRIYTRYYIYIRVQKERRKSACGPDAAVEPSSIMRAQQQGPGARRAVVCLPLGLRDAFSTTTTTAVEIAILKCNYPYSQTKRRAAAVSMAAIHYCRFHIYIYINRLICTARRRRRRRRRRMRAPFRRVSREFRPV